MELYCVQLGFLLGDDATIWYSIVWHPTVWYGEEEFGFVLDDNGFGGWHNVGWWVAQWNRWQCAQGATCHRCHQLSVIPLPSTKQYQILFSTNYMSSFSPVLTYTFWYRLLLAATFATEIT